MPGWLIARLLHSVTPDIEHAAAVLTRSGELLVLETAGLKSYAPMSELFNLVRLTLETGFVTHRFIVAFRG